MTTTITPVTREILADQLSDMLLSGGTFGDVYDYTEEDYEVLYALGHSLYSQGRYRDATKAFAFLVMHNHLERRFINAFAASLQMVKNYQEALQYYSIASVMDMTDPTPTFHSAECLIALGRAPEACEALDVVLRQCTSKGHEPMKERAHALRQLLQGKGATDA